MTKKELIEKVSGLTALTESQATSATDAVFGTITKELLKGNKVQILGFGTFSVKIRKARKGRNPRTGEEIEIPASVNVHFKQGKNIKAAMNE